MKIKKGLPPGYIPVREDIRPLVEKMHEIDPADLKELDAFMDYLQKGPEEFQETEPEEGKSSRIYEFMNGGLKKDETPGSDSPEAETDQG